MFRRILDYSNKNPWLYAVYVVLVGLPLVLIITFCCSGSSDRPDSKSSLNDPSLTDFSFSNMQMPLPHLEPRVAPKLMKALERNTYITTLNLSNVNMQKPEGPTMAAALKVNKTLVHVNIESNNVDTASMCKMAEALKENT